jgi:nitrogen regulatory protein PII
MQPCKRIEIVIEQRLLDRTIAALDGAGATGYTVVRGISGRGDRGRRGGDEVTDVFTNCLIVVACDHAQLQALVESVRPLLTTSGGVCLISDALWLRH